MTAIKTYTRFEDQATEDQFFIQTMREHYQQRGGQTDSPHRHQFYTLLLVRSGCGSHMIDFRHYPLRPAQVHFVLPGQVHQFTEEGPTEGYVLVFSAEFLLRYQVSAAFIESLRLHTPADQFPPLDLRPHELQRLQAYADEMLGLQQTDTLRYRAQAQASLLQLFFVRCTNLCSMASTCTYEQQSGALLGRFRQLVEEHHTHWHAVGQYAQALGLSADYLNRIVKTHTQRTAKEYIQARVVLAAKRLLYFTTQSAKEIGYELGFSESANFSAFFKKATGLAPSDFRSRA